MSYWLFKSEPNVFSISDLSQRANQTEHWDGVRNYQARNMLRDQIKVGDQAFFYHSNCEQPGIAGIMKIVKSGYPDFTAWDLNSKYYDSSSSAAHPRWFMVNVCFVRQFSRIVTLRELKQHPLLSQMLVTRKGNRLSITPVTKEEWDVILAMASSRKLS